LAAVHADAADVVHAESRGRIDQSYAL
jgi:hypothetical protein